MALRFGLRSMIRPPGRISLSWRGGTHCNIARATSGRLVADERLLLFDGGVPPGRRPCQMLTAAAITIGTLPAASSRCCRPKHSHDGPAASSLFLAESIGVKLPAWLVGPEPGPGSGGQREATFSHQMPTAIQNI